MRAEHMIPELLAPAGNADCFMAAVRYGADAVYLGGKDFGMRAGSANFDLEELAGAVKTAHSLNKKVYLTCNTTPTGEEIDALPDYLTKAAKCGIDALIVGDIGVLGLAKRYTPGVPLHISTQAGVMNHATATEFFHMGAERVVLARELSLDQIKEIREQTPPELSLEAFVHGAMCMSFSGRCLLSSYLTGRDANRGQCAQPCRWEYRLVEEKRPGEYYPIVEDEQGSYILNAKDLCMIEHIDKLAAAGIDSLKIEGRAKSFYYVGVVTNAYRMALDLYGNDREHYKCPEWLIDEVNKVSHREYSTGFYFGLPQNSQITENGGYIRQYDVVCTVDRWESGIAYCTQRGKFSVDESVEVLSPGMKPITLSVHWMKNEAGEEIRSAPHPMMKLSFPCDTEVPPGSLVRKENK